MICANCRSHHNSVAEVRNCTLDGSKHECRHGLPTGQCVCTWRRGIDRLGTHRYVVRAQHTGFCSVCMHHWDQGTQIVRSGYTWGRWVHNECVEHCHTVWTNPDPEYMDALGPKPWLEELSTPPALLEREDELLLDPRDEIEDTCDALVDLLVAEGLDKAQITEWREMLPDVVDRTILMELADQLVEEECLEEWELEVEMMHLAGTSWS